MVVNARTDTYWRSTGAQETRFDETVRQLSTYHDAGSDCLFARSDLPSAPVLRALGVRRLSVGSAPYRLGMATVRDAFADLQYSGRQEALHGADCLTYQNLAEVLPEPEQP